MNWCPCIMGLIGSFSIQVSENGFLQNKFSRICLGWGRRPGIFYLPIYLMDVLRCKCFTYMQAANIMVGENGEVPGEKTHNLL